jgi:DNA-nicking Smr family endonuclease
VNKKALKDEDQALFDSAMRDVKRLGVQAKIVPPRKPPQKKIQVQTDLLAPQKSNFSDHEHLDEVGSEDPLQYAKAGVSPKTLRALRQGKVVIEAKMDLHGQTIDEARACLENFLDYAHHSRYKLVLVIHGKGLRGKPVLKNRLNHWLRQSPLVLAFQSAKPSHGGRGAVYILIKS